MNTISILKELKYQIPLCIEEVLLYGDPVGDVGNEHALLAEGTPFP